jgi:hypothetical protein
MWLPSFDSKGHRQFWLSLADVEHLHLVAIVPRALVPCTPRESDKPAPLWVTSGTRRAHRQRRIRAKSGSGSWNSGSPGNSYTSQSYKLPPRIG